MEPLYTIQIGLGLQEHSIKVYPDRVVIQKPKDEMTKFGAVKKELQMQGIQFSGKLGDFLNAKYIGIDVTYDKIESVDFRPADSEIMMNGLLVINLKGRESVKVTFLNYAKTANAIHFRSDSNDTARQIKQYIDSKLVGSGHLGQQTVLSFNGCGCQKMRFFYQGDAIVSRSIGDAVRGSIELHAGNDGSFSIKFMDTSQNVIRGCCFEFDPASDSTGKKRTEYTEMLHEGRKYTCLCCFDLGDHMMRQYFFPGVRELEECARYMGISQVTMRNIATSEITGTRPL